MAGGVLDCCLLLFGPRQRFRLAGHSLSSPIFALDIFPNRAILHDHHQ